MRRKLLGLLLSCFAASHCVALELNGLFTDNMVLQRGQKVPVWGVDEPLASVSVRFAGQEAMTEVSNTGRWQLELRAMQATVEPQAMTVTSSRSERVIKIRNILIGDVWLCTGQSNMASVMRSYKIWDQVKNTFRNDQIRLFKTKMGGVAAKKPGSTVVADLPFRNAWQPCRPEYARIFSATGGFFGMKLQRDTGVPVGLIYATRGSTSITSWMPAEALESRPEYARFMSPAWRTRNPFKENPDLVLTPSWLFNGTIYPLAPFAVRGVIWYQGESDSRWPELYESLQGDMVRAWRKLWGYEFPFLYVQLAPYKSLPWDKRGEAWAWFRQAQTDCLTSIPNSRLAVITDAGEHDFIHPEAKDVPGERLATLAAALDDPSIDASYPAFKDVTINDGKVMLRFSDVSGGLNTRRVVMNISKGFLPGKAPEIAVVEADALKGFTICGADRKFVDATARIVGKNAIEVSSADVPQPVAVRYAWANFPLCNVYGGNGLPAIPFRTDAFPMPNLIGEK